MTKRDHSKVYNVTLVNEARGLNKTIRVHADEYILDAAEAQGISLPTPAVRVLVSTVPVALSKALWISPITPF